ncbi:MAG: M67 family metallopeptidase [Sulfuricaulis sp.]|nr:M67 family metallopeptidase [Sulfuricaulis sp.]
MNAIQLPLPIVDELMRLAQASPQEEICGLISRDRHGLWKCYPVSNRAEDRKHFFMLDPKEQIDVMRTMRHHGEELAAIYHSHPDSPPLPSPTDIAQHEYTDVLYLIISPGARDKPELRGFYIHGHAIEEVAIGLEEKSTR